MTNLASRIENIWPVKKVEYSKINPRCYDVFIVLQAGEFGAPCVRFTVEEYSLWKKYSPKIFCDAAWVYDSVDWHASSGAGGFCYLCWVLNKEWSQWIESWSREGISNSEIQLRCSEWLVANVELLLRRHYIGRTCGMTEWPKGEWDEYEHHKVGISQFIAESLYRLPNLLKHPIFTN